MADRKLDYQIGVDASKGITGVKQFSSTVKKELKSIEGDFDDTATAGQKVATVLSKMASELDTELDRAAQAAEALQPGPRSGSRRPGRRRLDRRRPAAHGPDASRRSSPTPTSSPPRSRSSTRSR